MRVFFLIDILGDFFRNPFEFCAIQVKYFIVISYYCKCTMKKYQNGKNTLLVFMYIFLFSKETILHAHMDVVFFW